MSELQKELFDIATGNLCAWVVEKESLTVKEAMRVVYSSKLYEKLQDPETGLCEMERIDVPEAVSLPAGVETNRNALPLCLGRLNGF